MACKSAPRDSTSDWPGISINLATWSADAGDSLAGNTSKFLSPSASMAAARPTNGDRSVAARFSLDRDKMKSCVNKAVNTRHLSVRSDKEHSASMA
jgi:hypothetical protein